MLEPGDAAPDFDLHGTAGDGVGAYRLSAAASRAPVVVAFVPGDDPSSRSLFDELAGADWEQVTDAVAVFGVVPASIEQCQSLAADQHLPYPVLADHARVADQFGVRGADGTVRRTIFVVDQQCRVRGVAAGSERKDGVPDLDPVLETLEAL